MCAAALLSCRVPLAGRETRRATVAAYYVKVNQVKLPQLEHPDRYAGLFVVDLGDSAGVGYTAEEVAMLLESEQYAEARVYRIHRASPQGHLELQAVSGERFGQEAGLFFYFAREADAEAAYRQLQALANGGLPCRARLLLADLPEGSRWSRLVGLAYPAECDPDIARWMLDRDVRLGEYADGGIGRLQTIQAEASVLDSSQLEAAGNRQSRSRDEVLRTVGQPVQRIA